MGWDAPDGTTASGVWIPRRHTGAPFNALAGGRLFPGHHDTARFTVDETAERLRVAFDSARGAALDVTVQVARELGPSELFADADAASSFFEDTRHVPAGVAQLDCALLMRDVPVEWHALAPFAAPERQVPCVA